METLTHEVINPKSKEEWLRLRTQDITSTDIAALFGISPYLTEFELWHRKKDGLVVELEGNERMKWGTRLQASIAAGVAQDQGWMVRPMDEYIRIPSLKIGSSFDFSIEPSELSNHVTTPGILEIKNVDALAFKDGWIVDGDNIEAPAHIELQAQQQLLVSGREYAYIAGLVGGNTVKLIRRQVDEKIHQAILARVAAFWASIESNTPPQPDFSRDIETIKRLHNFGEPGKVKDAKGDDKIAELVTAYKQGMEQEKAGAKQKETAKAELLTLLGDADKVLGDGWTISAGMIGPAEIAFHRDGYRAFKVNYARVK